VSATDRRPVWLLDADVVVADRPGWDGTLRHSYHQDRGTAWHLPHATALTSRLAAISAGGLVEIRWVGPVPMARALSRVAGLPWWPAAGECSCPDARLAAALAVVRAGRRLVWTDGRDSGGAIPGRGPDRAELDAAGALLISPAPTRGLQPHDLDRIEAFLAADQAAQRLVRMIQDGALPEWLRDWAGGYGYDPDGITRRLATSAQTREG
jgi:hypothetical protein